MTFRRRQLTGWGVLGVAAFSCAAWLAQLDYAHKISTDVLDLVPAGRPEDDRRWLGSLPHERTVEGFTIVHATLARPERWGYVFDAMAASSSFTHQNTPVCFFGHTHVPIAFIRDTAVRGGTYTKFRVEANKRYFVNPGAVGQPRDNNPKPAYLIYDMDEGTMELRRVTYDFAGTQKKIREAGLGN